MYSDEKWYQDKGLLTLIGIVVAIPILVIVLIATFARGPGYREGACYKAYGYDSYIPVTVNKSIILMPDHSVKLVEIDCP